MYGSVITPWMVAEAASGNGSGVFCVPIPNPIFGNLLGRAAEDREGIDQRGAAPVGLGRRGTRGSDAIESDRGVCACWPGGGAAIGGGVRGHWAAKGMATA